MNQYIPTELQLRCSLTYRPVICSHVRGYVVSMRGCEGGAGEGGVAVHDVTSEGWRCESGEGWRRESGEGVSGGSGEGVRGASVLRSCALAP